VPGVLFWALLEMLLKIPVETIAMPNVAAIAKRCFEPIDFWNVYLDIKKNPN
jgi:hypothetical protein